MAILLNLVKKVVTNSVCSGAGCMRRKKAMEDEKEDSAVEVVGMTQLLDGGHRKFYELPDRATIVLPESDKPSTKTTSAALFSYIENNVIGRDEVFSGPYGLRKGKHLFDVQ